MSIAPQVGLPEPACEREQLEARLKSRPGHRSAAIQLSKLFEQEGDREAAWRCLVEARRANPGDTRLVGYQLRMALRLNRLTEANVIIAELGQLYCDDVRLLRPVTDVLRKQCRFAEVEEIARNAMGDGSDPVEALCVAMHCALQQGRTKQARALFKAAPSGLTRDPRPRAELAEVCAAESDFGPARRLAADAIRDLDGDISGAIEQHRIPMWRLRMQRLIDQINAFERAETILRRADQPKIEAAKGLCIIISAGSPQVTFMTALPALELMRKGYQVVFLSSEGRVDPGPTGNTNVDRLSGLLAPGGLRFAFEGETEDNLRHDWRVNWPKRLVTANGVNVFQPIFETMSNTFRRFSIDAAAPNYQLVFGHLLRKCDAMLAACSLIYEEIARSDFPVRVFAGAPHLVPNGVALDFCRVRGAQRNMRFVNFMPSYEHYFNNTTKLRTTSVSVEDLTRHSSVQRMPIFPRRDQFERWLARGQDMAAIEAKAEQVLSFKRARKSEFSPEARAALERVRAAKAVGRPVVCVFGKITFDICEPEQGGPAHADIKDWINDTVRAARASEALFLVKPHPNEMHATFGGPTEFFLDLLEEPIPENVIVCGHQWFNISDVVEIAELGVVWAGTSALELGAAGIPCVVCNKWGARDHPANFPTPRDRAHYHAIMRDPRRVSWTGEQRQRCRQIIEFLSTDEVMIPFPYAQMPMRHAEKIPRAWDEAALTRYFEAGDPHMDRVVCRLEDSLLS